MKSSFALALLALASSAAGQSLVEPGATVQKLGGDMKFTEGPVWIPAQKKLIFSDIPNNKLMEWTPEKGISVFREESQQTNGNILDLEGRLLSCQHAARQLVRTEPDGAVTILASHYDGKRFNSPNDAAVKSDGSIWFTDPPWGLNGKGEIPGHWVFRLDPASGTVTPVIKDLAMPNGIVFSPDESRLYVADTGGHPRHPDAAFHHLPAQVVCYAIEKNGHLGRKLFHIEGGSDGMAVDVKGNIYTTHGKAIHVYDADGKKREEIPVPEAPANCAFGGEDFRTLFITARTSLYSIRLINPGARPPGAKW